MPPYFSSYSGSPHISRFRNDSRIPVRTGGYMIPDTKTTITSEKTKPEDGAFAYLADRPSTSTYDTHITMPCYVGRHHQIQRCQCHPV